MTPTDSSTLSLTWDAVAKIGALMLAGAKSCAELWKARKAQEVRLERPTHPDSYLVQYGVTVFNRSGHTLTVMDIGFWKFVRFGFRKHLVHWKAPNLKPIDIAPKSQRKVEPDNLTARSVVVNALKKGKFDADGMWISTGAGDYYYTEFARDPGPGQPTT